MTVGSSCALFGAPAAGNNGLLGLTGGSVGSWVLFLLLVAVVIGLLLLIISFPSLVLTAVWPLLILVVGSLLPIAVASVGS